MATVAQRTTPSKAFYAILDETHGTLAKVDGAILFLADDGALTVIEPVHCAFLTALGEIGLADTQQVMDRMRGGYAGVCTSRPMQAA
jgi:hypothetical protein